MRAPSGCAPKNSPLQLISTGMTLHTPEQIDEFQHKLKCLQGGVTLAALAHAADYEAAAAQ
jgi:hypothetical protein